MWQTRYIYTQEAAVWHFVTGALTPCSLKYSVSGIVEKGRAGTGLKELPFLKV